RATSRSWPGAMGRRYRHNTRTLWARSAGKTSSLTSLAGGRETASLLELVASQAAVDGNDGAGDVSGEGRGKKADEVCHILRLAIATDRDLVLRLPFAVFGRIVATDLLGVDAARRDRVDGDPEFADLAREALGPGVDRGLGAEGAVDAFGLR